MQDQLIASIEKMIPNGKRLELPRDDHFSNYAQVKKALLTAGGKYKKNGFEFTEEAAEIKARLVGGELVNDKKKFQFFATPPELADRLVELAYLDSGHDVLEPSAGQGAISNIIQGKVNSLVTVELMPQNVQALIRQGYNPLEADFLTLAPEDIGYFDRIVANPPFTKNQDIDHIKHMFTFLKPEGWIITLASKSWITGSQKKQVSFREWLDDMGATVTDIPAGAFKTSGTNISSVIIEITK